MGLYNDAPEASYMASTVYDALGIQTAICLTASVCLSAAPQQLMRTSRDGVSLFDVTGHTS